MKIIIALLTLLFSLPVFSQDTTKNWTFKKNILYWTKWQTYPLDASVRMPEPIKTVRQNTTQLPIKFDSITDNPLRHGATYLALETEFSYRNKVSLFADLYGEHRGVSYGIYDRNNTVVYPVIRIEARDTINVLSNQLVLSGRAGQFLNERLDEGLTIYNIDVQGFQIRTRLKNFELQYTIYGDLNNGIGLNIDDLQAFTMRKNLSNDEDYAGFSWVIARPPFYPLKNFYNLNLFGRKGLKSTELYAQVGYRPFKTEPDYETALLDKMAFVIGAKTKLQGKKLKAELQAELRYYGWQFNFIYGQLGLRYRKPAKDFYEMYANTIGKHLYPLRKYSTPFSQWAVFTEYAGYNMMTASIQGKLAYNLSNKVAANLDYDVNLISGQLYEEFFVSTGTDRNTVFVYPFFEPGLRYTPSENFKASVFVSNKGMNLDLHYPTHYLFAKPVFGLSVEANF